MSNYFDVRTTEQHATNGAGHIAADDPIKQLCRMIHIIIPHRKGEGIHPMLAEYSIQWVMSGMAVTYLRDPFGGFIELTRNVMVRHFLAKRERRFLLMLDNDVVPEEKNLPLLLARHDFPVVTGVACGVRPDLGLFACFTVPDDKGTARFPSANETKIMPRAGTREIESCGAGVMMIRRDVLETICAKEAPFTVPEALRIEAPSIGVLRKTEDICFSDRVHAAGYSLHVDFEAQCFHDKNIPLHWGKDGLVDMDPAQWDVSAFAPAQQGDAPLGDPATLKTEPESGYERFRKLFGGLIGRRAA